MQQRLADSGSQSIGVEFVDVAALQAVDFEVNGQAVFGNPDLWNCRLGLVCRVFSARRRSGL